MLKLAQSTIPLLLGGLCIATTSWAASCEGLTSLSLTQTSITAAETVAAGAFSPPPSNAGPAVAYKDLPEFCGVRGVIQPSRDSHIEFEVWLPLHSWNSKYVGVGNGGFAGGISYAGMADALRAGYATSSTDTGHKGTAFDSEWARGHPEKIIDYGYRAIHETAEKSKAIVREFYGGNAKRSYFSSCSNGGRQALLEAQRYPADYDGIIAGAPANFFTHLLAGFIWDAQAVDANSASYIPPAKLPSIEAAALTACDTMDGVKDGVIDDPSKCHFDPAALLCTGPESDSCLTQPQVTALRKIYAGPSNKKKGEQIFPGYVPGGETGPGGWTPWITGAASGKSLQYVFGVHFFTDMFYQDTAWDYRTFDFERDMKSLDKKTAQIFNATDPNLKSFKDRGGKLLLYHGWSDAAIAPMSTVNYYRSVVAKMGQKEADAFVRLYMAPGVQHCGGGPGPNVFGATVSGEKDPQRSLYRALERWVEQDQAPNQIIAAKYKQGTNPSSGVARTRPLCPYPQVARYKGSGSTEDAANFACVAEK